MEESKLWHKGETMLIYFFMEKSLQTLVQTDYSHHRRCFQAVDQKGPEWPAEQDKGGLQVWEDWGTERTRRRCIVMKNAAGDELEKLQQNNVKQDRRSRHCQKQPGNLYSQQQTQTECKLNTVKNIYMQYIYSHGHKYRHPW